MPLLWQALQGQNAPAAALESCGAVPAGAAVSQEAASAACAACAACTSGALATASAATTVEVSGSAATSAPPPAESGLAAPGRAACCADVHTSSDGAHEAAGAAAPSISPALDAAGSPAVAQQTGLPAQVPQAASVDNAIQPAPQDPLSSPNLRYLANFLDHGAAEGASLQNAEPAAEAAPGGKRQRRATQTGRAMQQFDALAQGVYGMDSGDPDGQPRLGSAFGATDR